jgi:hypothetical protein
MIDVTRLRPLQSSLGVDGYRLDAAQDGDRIDVTISASPGACADCLVPKDVLRGILGQLLGVAEEAIDLSYPGEPGPPGHSGAPA